VTQPGAAAQLAALQARRARVVTLLSGATVLVYFGFILLVAFWPRSLARVIAPGLSLGIVLGAAVIVLAWVFTAIYVRWANSHYDAALQRLREEHAARPHG
jgi:uncharacterized membrane protein (DUF485 family)